MRLFLGLWWCVLMWSGGVQAHPAHTAEEGAVHASPSLERVGHGAFRYAFDREWGALDPAQYPIKNAHAMVELRGGDFLVLCDDDKHNLLRYGADGALKRACITEYPGAHGLELFEENGEEFLLIVDSGYVVRGGKQSRQSGRVVKCTTEGQLLFSLGHPQTVGAYEPGQKYMPCDAAVAPNGDIYVADGYGSQWVLQYDKHGRFIRKFGGAEDPNPAARLKNSHGVSVDMRNPAEPRLLVSSRNENKLKVFTLDGEFVENIELPGAFCGQAVVHGDELYVGACWSKDEGTGKRLQNPGFVLVLDKDNRVVSCPGGTEPHYKREGLQPVYQTEPLFKHVHDLCVDRQGNIFVVQWNAAGAYPMKLERLP